MKIGIVGLGLIGGSMAKTIKENTDHFVLGFDLSDEVLSKAKLIPVIDGVLTKENLSECDFVILSIYPSATVDFVKKHQSYFKKGALVIDCCGVKEYVCACLKDVAENNDFVFMGGHPMAGIAAVGFDNSLSTMFKDASMILTPYSGTNIRDMKKTKELFLSLGFSEIKITTPESHDKMIAYTSQLAHIVSSAYIKNPLASDFKGFSAGSFKDMTRVAKLNETMWTELFYNNKIYLQESIDTLIECLNEYKEALDNDDKDKMFQLLKEGRQKRENMEDYK